MDYKQVKKTVRWCKKCDHEIWGNGSIVTPYQCNCGVYEYDNEKNDYIIN